MRRYFLVYFACVTEETYGFLRICQVYDFTVLFLPLAHRTPKPYNVNMTVGTNMITSICAIEHGCKYKCETKTFDTHTKAVHRRTDPSAMSKFKPKRLQMDRKMDGKTFQIRIDSISSRPVFRLHLHRCVIDIQRERERTRSFSVFIFICSRTIDKREFFHLFARTNLFCFLSRLTLSHSSTWCTAHIRTNCVIYVHA